MNWEKIKKSYYYKEPVEHILAPALYNIDEYDSLYRNQNNLSHQVWQDFDAKYKIGFEFFKDLREFNKDKEVICLCFFKDRDDKKTGNDVDLEGKIIKYKPNTFLITRSKNIKIIERKSVLPNRPVLQLDLNIEEYNKIIKMVG